MKDSGGVSAAAGDRASGTEFLRRYSWLAVSATPIPIWAGILAGPSLSNFTEPAVLLALLAGVLVGMALWVVAIRATQASDGAAHPLLPQGAPAARLTWLLAASLLGGLGATWFGQSASDWGQYLSGHAALVTDAGIVLAVVLAGGLAHALMNGQRGIWVAVAVGGLVIGAWVVLAHAVNVGYLYPMTFARSVAFACPGCRLPFVHVPAPPAVGYVNDAGLAAACMLLGLPWALRPVPPRSPSLQHAGATLWPAVGAGAITWVLMVFGTQLGSGFGLYNVAWALMILVPQGVLGLLATLVAELGSAVLFLALAWSTAAASQPPSAKRPATLALGMAAALAAGLGVFNANFATAAAQIIATQTGVFALAYVVAPWVGVLLAQRWVQARRGAPSTRPNAAGMAAAWVGGLLCAIPGLNGWDRWTAGKTLQALVTGQLARPAVRLDAGAGAWALVGVQRPDWGLLAGLLGAAVLYAGGSLLVGTRARAGHTSDPARG